MSRDENGRQLRLLVTGGGTGGHLFPAVATAQALQKREADCAVHFIGTRRKIDNSTLRRYGFSSSSVWSYGLKGKNLIELIKALLVLPVSVIQAIQEIRAFRPDVALGVGGYVTGPVMLAAKILGVPTIIHEQNSIPGMANRKLGRIVNTICLSLPGSEKYFPAGKTVFTGNPVRAEILELARRQGLAGNNGKTTLLVLGGSQGAHALNTLMTQAVCDSGMFAHHDLTVIHQTGAADAEWVARAYEEAGVTAEVSPFFQNMEEVYNRADLLVSRAGATTLTELAVLGKPAILVPYPYAADNHQQHNAEYYVQAGGAQCMKEQDLTDVILAKMIVKALHKDTLEKMGQAMRSCGAPEAAEHIVDACQQLATRKTVAGKQTV